MSKMTKQHFELIASVLNREISYWQEAIELRSELSATPDECQRIAMDAVIGTALNLADKLESTNPEFDRERFLVACGVKQ